MAQLRIKMMDKNVVVKLRSNAVTKSTIKTVFMLADDALVTMAYEEGGIPILCEVDDTGKTFLLPDGWESMEFHVESNQVPSRPATPMDICQSTASVYVPIETDALVHQLEKSASIMDLTRIGIQIQLRIERR
ncbi:unnamed protein product [Caenorhabditis auriculariae]|uniref:Uncharacterized protein n=1 Tax=Caenorhabditis auriculariae TaxID=2777116 RepID=A0A8S1HHS5_9PELO|nr:unnamed protein product [Caenorhabditis auriculariae]